jgi:GAF domain-containing protein
MNDERIEHITANVDSDQLVNYSLSNLKIISQLYHKLITGFDPQSSFQSAMEDLQNLLSGDRVAILLKAPDRQVLKVFASAGYSLGVKDLEIPINAADTGWVLTNQRSLRIPRLLEPNKNQKIKAGSVYVVPIAHKEKNFGVFITERNTNREHTSSDEEIINTICSLFGYILSNYEIKKLLEQEERLSGFLSNSVIKFPSLLDNQDIINTASQEIGKSLDANKVQITIGIDDPKIKIDSVESNFESSERIFESGRNSLLIPIILKQQQIGLIISERDTAWTDEEQNFIEAIAFQVSRAIENVQLLIDKRKLYQREELITEISSKVWASQSVELILQTAIKEIGIALGADEAVITLD